ncbi:hypothetical protein J2S52_000303 [Streptomyces sp. DSM 41037]|nr:hypothetical protein [Streptomyces sp. DSM 41037]
MRAAGDAFDAAPAAARAQLAVEVDADVADVAGVPAGPGVQAATEDQPAADTRGDDHAEGVVVAARRALPVFGGRDGDAVADQPDRPRPHHLPDPLDEREVTPAGDVHRTDRAGGGVDRSGAADAERAHPLPLGPGGEFPERGVDGAHHPFTVLAGRGRPSRPQDDTPLPVDQGGGDLGPADVECGGQVGTGHGRSSCAGTGRRGRL